MSQRPTLEELRKKLKARKKAQAVQAVAHAEELPDSKTKVILYYEKHKKTGHRVLLTTNAVHCFNCKKTVYDS